MLLAIQILSWLGSIGILGAQWYLARKERLDWKQFLYYHLVNAFGGVSVGILTYLKGAYQSTLLQTVWAIIAVYAIVKILKMGQRSVFFYFPTSEGWYPVDDTTMGYFPVLANFFRDRGVKIIPTDWNDEWSEIPLDKPAAVYMPSSPSFDELCKQIDRLRKRNFVLFGELFVIVGHRNNEIVLSKLHTTIYSQLHQLLRNL